MNKINGLIIGDLHEPFCLEDYLKFNKELYKKYKCGWSRFAGDLVDAHAWSYHEHNPDGRSAGDELDEAIHRLKRWYKAFPDADVTLGNHDYLIARKAKTAGLSGRFLKDFREVIEAPKAWRFRDEYIKDGVLHTHGSIGNAFKRALMCRMSVVQGHLHSEMSVQWSVSEKDKIFGLQVGCGIDRKAYGFEYGKPFAKKPVIGSGLLLDGGRLPIVELMNL